MKRVLLFTALICSLFLNTAFAQDMIDFRSAQIVAAPDVHDWPVTTSITQVSIQNGTSSVIFNKQDGPERWPDVTPDGWDGSLQYTLWLCVQTPTWACSGFVQMWYGRPGSGKASDPDVPSTYDRTRYYDARWSPMFGHGPIRPGELIAVLVTSGNERGAGGPFSVKERSNVVTFPATDNGVFVFPATPASVPSPTPTPTPVPQPGPIVVPAPQPPASNPPGALTLPTDLSAILHDINAQVNACNVGIASVNQNVTDGRKENTEFQANVKSIWQQIGGPLLKYVVPAVTAYLAGKHL
jgi:hypothetical protein